MMSNESSGFQEPREQMESIALGDDVAPDLSPPLSSPPPFGKISTEEDDIGHDPLYSPPNPLSDPLQHRSQSHNPDHHSFILEPPSYADAVFQSFDAYSDVNGHDFSTSLSPPSSSSSSSSDYLVISVTDPRREQELSTSLGGYFTYLISTRTNLPEYDGAEFNVRRRFRDVVTLSDRLSESYRGYLIPVRPDKSVVESQMMQQMEFVEQRRVALAKYLRKLAKHPVIRRSEELKLFLQVQEKLPLPKTTDAAPRMLDGAEKLPKQLSGAEFTGGGVVVASEVFQPVKGGRDLLMIFKELKQSMSNDWGASKPPVVEEDSEFMERRRKLQDLELQLSNVSLQAEELVKAQQNIGETVGQLGLAFVKLTKFETEEAVYDSQRIRATDMKNVATAAVKASRLYRELNSQTVKHLDKLHDYLGMMLAVNNVFSDRSNALLTLQTLLSELSSLNLRIEKLEIASSKIFGGDRSRLQKIEDLKETVKVTENAKSSAISEYERIKENNKSELDRLDRERHEDFLSMLRGFVVNQAGYAEKLANVWETVAEDTKVYAKSVS